MEFKEPLHTPVFTTRFVVKNGSPIVYVSHDEDGDWQFLGKEEDFTEEDGMLVALQEVIINDPSVLEVSHMPVGYCAVREHKDAPWQIMPE
jgi:hypothetical protein